MQEVVVRGAAEESQIEDEAKVDGEVPDEAACSAIEVEATMDGAEANEEEQITGAAPLANFASGIQPPVGLLSTGGGETSGP